MRMKQVYVAALAALCAVAMLPAGPSGGTIKGKATYEGTPVKPTPIDMSKEPSCAKQHATPLLTESVVTGPNNALENVAVYVSTGAPDETTPPSQPVRLDQKGCQYLPHVLAFQVNQSLEIANDDQTSHNIHPLPKANREWNKSQPAGSPPISEKYDKPEFIPVKCNIHPWMRGRFAVFKNSHYAVTGSDGSFTLPNLPPGKYTITAWQESYGEQTQEVTIGGGETKAIDFVLKAKAY